MSNENLATLRDPINPEARSWKLEDRGEISAEAAELEVQTEVQREKNQVEELGKASDDPEAKAVTQASIVELEGVREKYSKQLDSVASPGEQGTTIREPAKVYDFQEEKTLREQRATLRAGFKNKQAEDEEINKAIEESITESGRPRFEKIVSIQPETSAIDRGFEEIAKTQAEDEEINKVIEGALDEQGRTATQKMEDEPSETQETLRSERLRKRMEHVVSDFETQPTVRGTELIETSSLAESVRAPEAPDTLKDTLKSAEFDPTLREEVPPTLQEEIDMLEEDQEQSEEVLKATQEGLKELSGDEWSDLYQQSEFAWTPEVWGNLNNQALAGETSEREQLRQLAMNKAEIGLSLAANALALKKLADLDMSVSEGHSLFLEKRKLEQGLAQDKAKEKELFEAARERAETVEVDVAELAETPVDALVAKINKPPSGYTDEELERMAKESANNKTPVSSLERAGGGLMYGTAAVGLAVLAKVTWSLFSGKAAFKMLDWIDKGMEKIQKYAFKNDFSSIFDIAKDTGDAIHKKLDESIAKGEKKEP
ncbi:MAG: hypothetical protein WCW31_04480 [Patescibacteria group bacterium]|jgi:hypothetical protein